MKIVVLDGHTLNPGDLSWDGIRKFGDLTVYERTPAELVAERAAGASIVFTNKTPLGESVIRGLADLRYIGVLATGYNVVDVGAARGKGIVVANIPDYGSYSVAQMTFALLLELCHRVQRHSDSVMAGGWARSRDWCYWESPLVELAGKTMGIIGYGSIGRKVGAMASAFGMKVMGAARHHQGAVPAGFSWASIGDILAQADVVSIHCQLTPETKGLINRDRLRTMKPTAFLLNTSRGPIIVEEDLAAALTAGTIAGAGLDVLSVEPPAAANPLYGVPNCIITPHIAWATKEARARLMAMAVENLAAFTAGKPVNVVNG